MDLLKDLNPEQLAAVKHQDGPLLIVAGAGTGKTTVIAQRIAYLIEEGKAGSEEILALTFTEKAAGEMAERVESLLPYGYFDLWISTFHSFAERILKEHGLSIGLSTDFKLLNEFEQWALIKKNLAKFDLDYYRPLGNPTKFIRALLKHFSRAKDEDISPAQYLAYAGELKEDLDGMLGGNPAIPASHLSFPKPKAVGNPGERGKNTVLDSRLRGNDKEIMDDMTDRQETARINEAANAYHVYQQLLLDNNALDFGDLINYCLKLFRERPAILEKYRRQFKYIMLDEFQDTNWSQYELIKLLAEPKNNLAVVGDDDQSIFRFRGASMSNILQFSRDYPAAKKIILTKNYRSGQNILDLSYEFIKQNNPNRLEWQLENQELFVIASDRRERSNLTDSELNQRLPRRPEYGAPRNDKGDIESQKLNKKLIAQNDGRGEIEVIAGADLAEEAGLVADKIGELKNKDQDASWDDFAILVRANDSANVFINELDRRRLPYIFGARRGLYAKPVIMDIIAYFKLLDNYHESISLWRILNLPVYDFTATELADFNQAARQKAWSLYEALNRADRLKFSEETLKKIRPLLALIAKHTGLAREKAASEIFLAFMNDSGYLKYLAGQAERESAEAIGLLNQFLKRIRDFEAASTDKSVKSFLAELNLEMEAGEEGSLAADLEAGPEAIKILTAHGAKGLEFKYVFIANLVDKRFPTLERGEQISLPDALVKEILPVGDTHLEEERRLFYVAMTRARFGLYFSWARDYGGLREKKPSRFLMELGLEKKSPLIRGDKGGLILKEEKLFKSPPTPFIKGGEIPTHFSYSQLAAYSNCPYQYRFAHILKIPVMGKEQFSFGKTMHATLQKLFMLVNEKRGLGQPGLFEKNSPLTPPCQGGQQGNSPLIRGNKGGFKSSVFKSPPPPFIKGGNITFEEILKLYEQSWLDDWYESKEQKRERKKQGREILKVFHEKYNHNWPEVLFLEKGFNLKIVDGQDTYIVRGVIDRIDRAGDGLKLVDYKTGRAKAKLIFQNKKQLFIYQLAAGELFKQPVSGLAFYYLDNNSEVEFIGTPAELAKIKLKIIFTIKEISRGEFPPRPSQLCAWCDFREICEYRA